MQRSRLGRGLASLIGDAQPEQPIATRMPPEGHQRLIPVERIKPSATNPRRFFDEVELGSLADSIREKGLVQPIVVRPMPGDGQSYEIVAGERRWRASQIAGLHVVPVIVRELNDQETLELAIIENVQREDLNAIEEACGYKELIERFSYTQDKLAEVIGKSRSHLANILRLLKLPTEVQDMVKDGRLSPGHARALIGREDALRLAHRIVDEDLNVRAVEAMVQDDTVTPSSTKTTRRSREKDADTKAFERDLAQVLGLPVEIKPGAGESGSLTIRFTDFDQLDDIRLRLMRQIRAA
ncbi:MAG: ParB/RepB/Spo0J family partition protein [Pseudomonadota bacterium]